MPSSWIPTTCALCAMRDDVVLFEIRHEDAPDGRSAMVRCQRCGLRRLDPRPDPASLTRYYAAGGKAGYNAYAGRTRSHWKQAVWELLRDGASRPPEQPLIGRLLRPISGPLARWMFDINVDLGRQPGRAVLEVGCGYGDLLLYLKSRGASVTGTDLSPDAVSQGHAHGLDLRLGLLRELALPGDSFDHLVTCHSLEHMPDPGAEIAEFCRLLRPGGELHIAVPNGDSGALQLDGARWGHLSFPLHFWLFDGRTLTELLARHSFRIVRGPKTIALHHLHHALGTWRKNRLESGVGFATRALGRWLRVSSTRTGGEILRFVAVKQPGPAISRAPR
ncbi:MAG TPA: class I SAM-dependent methyltransferase [Candidatus Limnocylindria bacterium]|nr:class I SAM-dependent methyltransferase [Candidatus Limnocylindria bacterium]